MKQETLHEDVESEIPVYDYDSSTSLLEAAFSHHPHHLGENRISGAVWGGEGGIVLFHIYIYTDMTGTMACLGKGGGREMREEEQGKVAT